MRTYKLTMSYDGARYQGWQRQKDTDRTIQGILEQALEETVGYEVEADGSGRTDGGVHAKGQTASIILAGRVDEKPFLEKLNSFLPEDIRVWKMGLEKNGFHARHSAKGKCYEYVVDMAEKPDVFARKYAAHYPGPLDAKKMQRAAGYLLGTHDFSGFTDRKDEKSSVRRIDSIEIREEDGKLYLEYQGSGFLYHMVRILTGTLLEVGKGERTPESIPEIIEKKERSRAGFLAPACGLFLKEVYYVTRKER